MLEQSIDIPSAANDNPYESNILRLKNTIQDATQKFLIPGEEISGKYKNVLQDTIGDIMDFQHHFSTYIKTEGMNQNFNDSDLEIILLLTIFLDWKNIQSDRLTDPAIIGGYESINHNIGVIQKLLLWKLGIENDVTQGSDPWDRIAWEITTQKKAATK